MTNVLQQQLLYFFTWKSNQLLNLNIFSFLFLQTFLLINSIYRFISVFTLKSSAIHWLTCFRVSSRLFPVLFWMLWMLVTVHKLCHVPHTSRITTCGTIFMERHFSVSKEWVRSWSHAFIKRFHRLSQLIMKRWLKSLLAVRPEKVTRRKKRKKETRSRWRLKRLRAEPVTLWVTANQGELPSCPVW